jgi:very-short-patch-repair endonuclease
MAATPIDVQIARIGRRQHRLITRDQLLDLGLSRGAIAHRLATGCLLAVHPGVYAIGLRTWDAKEIAMAAVLAGGPGALLSHCSAAFFWGLIDRWWTPPEITLTVTHRQPARIRVHQSTKLAKPDRRRRFNIWMTSPARTALDIAPRLTKLGLARAVNEGRHNECLKLPHLAETLSRNPHHPGTKLLLPFVENDTGITLSGLEDMFLDFIERYDLPRPRTNVHRGRHKVDAFFPDHNLIVEVDSVKYHSTPQRFESDRDRDADALAGGTPTIRITEERMSTQPDREAARLRKILAQSGTPPPSTEAKRPNSGPSDRR